MIRRKAMVIPLVSLLACGCAIAPRARRYERPETDASPATFGRQVDVSNVTKRFGGNTALSDVSFSVPTGLPFGR